MPKDRRFPKDYYDDAYERIADGMNREYGQSIKDRDSFYAYFEKYMNNTNVTYNKKWKENSFDAYIKISPNTDIPMKQKRTVIKNTLENERRQRMEEIRQGQPVGRRTAQPSRIITKRKGKKARVRTFTILATSRGKRVYARKIKTKVGVRYVTKKGYRARKV